MEKITSIKIDQLGQIKKLNGLLITTGWNERQVDGQLDLVERFLLDPDNCIVLVVENEGEIVGFSSAQFYSWNRLAQIHGLIVHPRHRLKGIASQLVHEIETFMKGKNARGIYVDTPTNNVNGRIFYEKSGYKEDYIMTEYYDEGSDGVTYLKLFKWHTSDREMKL